MNNVYPMKTNQDLQKMTSDDRDMINRAIKRLQHSLTYGDDMRSSSYLCITEANAIIKNVVFNMSMACEQ